MSTPAYACRGLSIKGKRYVDCPYPARWRWMGKAHDSRNGHTYCDAHKAKIKGAEEGWEKIA